MSLAIVAEGEGIQGKAGSRWKELHGVAAEFAILHYIVHARLPNLDEGTPLAVSLNVDPLVSRREVVPVLHDV